MKHVLFKPSPTPFLNSLRTINYKKGVEKGDRMFFQTKPSNHARNNNFQPRNHPFMPHTNHGRPPRNNPVQGLINRVSNPQHSLKSFAAKSIGNIPKTLDNIQEIAKIVESTTPIVERYVPIVRSIPTMYKIMKSVNKAEASNDKTILNEEKPDVKEKSEVIRSGRSEPKLFI